MRTSLFWYTKDLRVEDLPGLADACSSSDLVMPVYVWDDEYLQDESANRLAFLVESLDELRASLKPIDAVLSIVNGETIRSLIDLCRQTGASHVYCSESRDPKTVHQQRLAAKALAENDIALHIAEGNYLIDRDDIKTASGNAYQVFTPFSKQAIARIKVRQRREVDSSKLAKSSVKNDELPRRFSFKASPSRQQGGSKTALDRWNTFFEDSLTQYSTTRDELSNDEGTSRLSPHLNFGTISVQRIVHDLEGMSDSEGKSSFLKELIWREFNYYLAYHFPSMLHTSFKKEFSAMEWSMDEGPFKAWKEGRTGFPVIDAAMRQLQETGWMHNRARMIVASFLVKDLHINWQSGEEYFMQWLTDGDQVQNNANWQWAASTGADAQPYFRIFNPVSQGKKFDPRGEYIRRWVPELRDVPDAMIHEPWLWKGSKHSYPAPIVDHSAQRLKALDMFKEAKERYEGR